MSKDWDVTECGDLARWDEFVLRSPQRSVFVQSRFLQALQAGYRLLVCLERGHIVAGAVVMMDEQGLPMRSVFPFTQYQGMLFADHAGMSTHKRQARELRLAECLVAGLAERYAGCCLCHSWRIPDLRAFQWHNYHVPHSPRFRQDLRYSAVLTRESWGSPQAHLAAVRSVRRQEYHKAMQGLQSLEQADAAVLVELYRRTFARQQIAVPDQEIRLVRALMEASCAGGFGKMAVAAMLDGTPVSAVLFLQDDRSAYYLFGANDPQYRHCFGGTFLLMHMIADAFDRGCQEVDLVGVNSPNRGDFKLSLNAELRPYFISTLEAA